MKAEKKEMEKGAYKLKHFPSHHYCFEVDY